MAADIVQAGEPFMVTLPNGVPFVINQGDRFPADDFVVAGRDRLFAPVVTRSSGYGANGKPRAAVVDTGSETADAPPAARRTVTRPVDTPGPVEPESTSEGGTTDRPSSATRKPGRRPSGSADA